jgi:hypothetical protein
MGSRENCLLVSGAAAKQRPVGGQAEPDRTQQGACAPADPSAPRGASSLGWVGCRCSRDVSSVLEAVFPVSGSPSVLYRRVG